MKRIFSFILAIILVVTACASMFAISAEEPKYDIYTYYMLTQQYGTDMNQWPAEAWYVLYGIEYNYGEFDSEIKILSMSDELAAFMAPYYWNSNVTYQWQTWNGYTWVNIEGATNIVYNVTNPTINQKYRVLITTQYTTFKSNEVVITGINDTVAPTVEVTSLYSYPSNYGQVTHYITISARDAGGVKSITVDGVEKLAETKNYAVISYVLAGAANIVVTDEAGNKTTIAVYVSGNEVKTYNFTEPSVNDTLPTYKINLNLVSCTAEKAVIEVGFKYNLYNFTYQWQVKTANGFVDINGENDSTLNVVNPVEGTEYRLRIYSYDQGKYYDTQTVVIPAIKTEPEFTANDIIITGGKSEVEVGDIIILQANYNGTWVYDSNFLVGSTIDSVAVFTAAKAGVTAIKYIVEIDGVEYTKHCVITIKNVDVPEVGTCDD